jgi:hypothetical protein
MRPYRTGHEASGSTGCHTQSYSDRPIRQQEARTRLTTARADQLPDETHGEDHNADPAEAQYPDGDDHAFTLAVRGRIISPGL